MMTPRKKIVDEPVDEPVEEVVQEEETQEETGDVNPVAPERVSPEMYLSSGITMLNLATTNHPDCFVERGTYILFVGQSGAGKSYVATQLLAEAANNPLFDDYELIYDDVEHGQFFDIPRMFGNKLAHRLRAPHEDESGMPIYSSTVEDFFFSVDDFQNAHKPFIYVLDSMDSLTSSVADTKFVENKEQRRKDLEKGKEVSSLTQGYGDGKAKQISGNLRRVVSRLRDTGSILIILSQVRDNITGMGARYTRSGGQALKFFAHGEFWFYTEGDLKRVVDKKERKYGQMTRVSIQKNRITGIKNDIRFPILLGAGISDPDSCIDWLIEEGQIIKPLRSNGLYEFPARNIKLNRTDLIRSMEDNFEPYKCEIVKTWNNILQAVSCVRKRKYE